MPEVRFTVRWPDGTASSFWSPSRVLRCYFGPGTRLTVGQFAELGTAALERADERVREKYGFRCAGVAATTEPVEVLHVD